MKKTNVFCKIKKKSISCILIFTLLIVICLNTVSCGSTSKQDKYDSMYTIAKGRAISSDLESDIADYFDYDYFEFDSTPVMTSYSINDNGDYVFIFSAPAKGFSDNWRTVKPYSSFTFAITVDVEDGHITDPYDK